MRSTFADFHPLYIVLAAWFLVWGLAAADLYDLSDDLLPPLAVLDQLVASELEEPDGSAVVSVSAAAVPPMDRSMIRRGDGWPGPGEPGAQRSCMPRYLQLAQCRI